ncbi:uncharacterized protein LOC141641923 [Silene latifolia]|uniref:uncharacterized protein LOC141641923 n=1 Tax=Silene latifolia TaxID=37657 RepID=UPI003D78008C
MVWNVQGTGNKNKISAIKEVVRTYRPTVLALLETHKDGVHAENVRKILGYTGHARVDAIGFSGGIWLYWHPEVVSVSPITHHNQFITVEIARHGSPPWFFSAVYASPNPHNRLELWSELEKYAHSHNLPWMLAGDFNETRSVQERHGGDQNMIRRCNAFNNWIDDCELIELEFSGPLHTWAREGVDDSLADIPYNIFQEFSNEHWDWLNKSYSQAEIERAIFDMGSLKAPGPDGFQALFYQKHWPVVKDDVCAMVITALEGKGLPEGMNDTNLVLIPKVRPQNVCLNFDP